MVKTRRNTRGVGQEPPAEVGGNNGQPEESAAGLDLAAKKRRIEEIDQERQQLMQDIEAVASGSNSQQLVQRTTGNGLTSSTPLSVALTDSTTRSAEDTVSVIDVLGRLEKGINLRSTQLPTFNGDSDEWDYFHAEFIRQTNERNIPAHENMKRLSDALKGKAKEHVERLLNKPSCLQQVLEELDTKFNLNANPSKDLLQRCQDVARVKPDDLSSLEKFCMDVGSLASLVERVNNETIEVMGVEYLKKKLDPFGMHMWGKVSREQGATFGVFQKWIKGYRLDFEAGGGCLKHQSKKRERSRSRERGNRRRSRERESRKRRSEESDDWRYRTQPRRFEMGQAYRTERSAYNQPRFEAPRAPKVLAIQQAAPTEDVCGQKCAEKHTLKDCPEYLKMSHMRKTEIMRSQRRCYHCIGLGHFARQCPTRADPQA